MGSFSTLRLNRLSLFSVKNSIFDHTYLFSKNDYKLIDYYYADNYSEQKYGYSRKLKDCAMRLSFFGYDNDKIKTSFETHTKEAGLTFSYDLLVTFLKHINIEKSVYDEVDEDYYIDHDELTDKIRLLIKSNECYKHLDCSETWEILDGIECYELLTILIYNNIFLDEDLCWEVEDIIQDGYVTKNDLDSLFDNCNKVLLITEGSTDSKIIQTALDWIYPDLSSYFEFIDMEKNYPFTGTGSIVNFYFGLCKIGPSKKIIFIFDNDTAGNNARRKCVSENHTNIKHIVLPSLQEFINIMTLGPSGENYENINGKAVSIELFLDLTYQNNKTPTIRWLSFDEHAGQYQGALINKDAYSKRYFRAYHKKDLQYNTNKLRTLLDDIISTIKNA